MEPVQYMHQKANLLLW